MTMKKLFAWLALGFGVFFAAFFPQSAAKFVKTIGGVLKELFVGFGDFFTRLVS